MKRLCSFGLCFLFLFFLAGCGNRKNLDAYSMPKVVAEVQEKVNSSEQTENANEASSHSEEETDMKLYFNNTEIPVIWENNETVRELREEVSKGDIDVPMSMYSDHEQVGSLGKNYTRHDRQITAHNGDIVLYSGNQIVVFYGSNSWAYTRLGKMDLKENEVTELLSNGNITLKITK